MKVYREGDGIGRDDDYGTGQTRAPDGSQAYPIPYAVPSIPKRSLREMARDTAMAFARQAARDPLSFGRGTWFEHMAGVIEDLLLIAARGEYRPQGLGPPSAEVRASMYRAAGLDPDGEPAGLPKGSEPEERPFIPNKLGEHD